MSAGWFVVVDLWGWFVGDGFPEGWFGQWLSACAGHWPPLPTLRLMESLCNKFGMLNIYPDM